MLKNLARMAEKYQAVQKGAPNSKDFRVFFSKCGKASKLVEASGLMFLTIFAQIEAVLLNGTSSDAILT